MTYADSLLTAGETVVLRSRQHWLALLSRSRIGLTLWLIAILVLFVIVWFNFSPGWLRDIPSGLALVLLALGAVVVAYRYLQWRSQEYLVTSRRLLKVGGVLSKHSGDSSLEKVNDAVLRQSLLGRMLKFGDLEIMTAAEEAVDRYHMLNDPILFKKTMLTAKHQLETGYYSPAPPTPPLRAEPPSQAAPEAAAVEPPSAPVAPVAPAPAAPAAAAAPQTPAGGVVPPPAATGAAPFTASVETTALNPPAADESLEITQTLARLADLRDSGAISVEEFEQKKSELLKRL